MANEFEVTSSGKRVRGDGADAQDARMAAIRAKKDADAAHAAKVEAAREAAAEQEAARLEAERMAAEAAEAEVREKKAVQREAAQKLGSAALAVGGAVASTAAQSMKKDKGEGKGSRKGLLFAIVVLVVAALLLFLAWPRISAALFPQEEPQVHTVADISGPTIAHNTTADISSAILGEARQEQELVVWEQDVQVESEVSQALANLPIFKKTKVVHSYGTGVFTVDMSKVDDAAIAVDEQAREAVISIPHAELRYVTKDLQKTEFEDTQHALLGFGDVKLTQEQQNALEQSIEAAMRAELETEACFADADEAALLVVYDVYQPLIAKVDDAYTLEVRFAD